MHFSSFVVCPQANLIECVIDLGINKMNLFRWLKHFFIRSNEIFHTRRLTDGNHGACARYLSCCWIDSKQNDIVRILICNDKKISIRRNVEISRCSTLNRNVLNERKCSVVWIHWEHGDRIVATVRCIKKFFGSWMKNNFGARVRQRIISR